MVVGLSFNGFKKKIWIKKKTKKAEEWITREV